MLSRRSFLMLAGGGVATALAGGSMAVAYVAAISEAEARVEGGSTVIPTHFGALEYAEAGTGQPLLMLHGTGGGFDQGLSFSKRLSDAGYRIIAPSRFGYLRSEFPGDPSSENQADALVELLDYLQIDSVPVAGGSAGALAATAFAIRHPDRCSALIGIVPASYAPDRPSAAPMNALHERAMIAMLDSDFLYWLALNTVQDQMIGTMLATDPAIVAASSTAEQARVRRILWDILPVSRRSRGLLNDARLAGNPAPMPLERITVPTLVISLEDDRFGTYDAARYMAENVKGARLVTYPTGGHIWAGHDEELFAEVDRFLKRITSEHHETAQR